MAKSPELGPTNSIPSSVIGSAGEPLGSFRWTWTGALAAPVTPNTVLGKDTGSDPKCSALITGVGVGVGMGVDVRVGMGWASELVWVWASELEKASGSAWEWEWE